MKEKTTAQICARMREIRESRSFHHVRKTAAKREVSGCESTMIVRGGRKLTGSYRTSRQLIDAYEQEEWGGLESRCQMFETGKGRRFTKRVNVNCKRPTAQGEVCSVGRVIAVKRFSNSRLTCVCKSVMY